MSAPKFTTDRSHYGDALRRWFAATVPGADDVEISDIDIPVATGFSNETVFFTATWDDAGTPRSDRHVARIEPADGPLFPDQNPETAVSVALQYRIMRAVEATSAVPVPPMLGQSADGTLDGDPQSEPLLGQPFFVMGFVDGVIPSDNPRYTQSGFLVDEATPDDRRRMVHNGLEAMAALHALDWRAAGLDWLLPAAPTAAAPSAESPAPGAPPVGGADARAASVAAPDQATQLALYRRFAEAELAGREHPVLEAALDWLEANDPHDERVGLSWGDARLGNIIWQDYEVAAVVDWEAAAICPTEADLGWWLMFDRMSFDDAGVARLEGYPTREEQIAHYAAVSGREVRDPHYWEVFGAMRFCAIFVRLADRMTAAGLIPAEANFAVTNPVTAAVARLLDLE